MRRFPHILWHVALHDDEPAVWFPVPFLHNLRDGCDGVLVVFGSAFGVCYGIGAAGGGVALFATHSRYAKGR